MKNDKITYRWSDWSHSLPIDHFCRTPAIDKSVNCVESHSGNSDVDVVDVGAVGENVTGEAAFSSVRRLEVENDREARFRKRLALEF